MSGGFRSALEALDRAGVAYRLRKAAPGGALPDEGELDVWLARREVDSADGVLSSAGFHHLRAPGHEGHRFYLGFDDGRWLKLDAKLEGRPDVAPRGSGGRVPRTVWGIRSGLGRRRPVGIRRAGPLVAVLGPDGAGKGTVIRTLSERIPVSVVPLYLGYGKSRAGAKDEDAAAAPDEGPRPANPDHGTAYELAALLWGVAREWRRLLPGYLAAWQGSIVLCDRHPIEVLAVRPLRTPAGARFERFLAGHLLPWPDAIVILDSPAELLYRRKPEHPLETLERWRRGYADEFAGRGGTVVSTAGPRDRTFRAASAVVWQALRARRRW